MSQSPNTPQNQPVAPVVPAADPYPPYRPVYAWIFQAWLLMFLGVICCSLVIYLVSYIPR